jgi:hypothetical protein
MAELIAGDEEHVHCRGCLMAVNNDELRSSDKEADVGEEGS